MWHIQKLNTINARDFYEILKLRIDTFVVSQNRIYHELDENDKHAFHIYLQDENKHILAYGRVFLNNGHLTFGRVVTHDSVRGTGIGKELIKNILSHCQKVWPHTAIIIESQEQVVGFYERFDFKKIGEPFIFEGTPHVKMILN